MGRTGQARRVDRSRCLRAVVVVALVVAVMVIGARPVLGHHGGAAYDQTKPVTLEGTVTAVQFENPHVLIFFDVKGENGATAKWSGWLTAPTKLMRAGWTKRTLSPGDHVTISGNSHKEGNPVVQIRKLVGPDGKELPLFEE
jgi:hypothetical protein